MKWPWLLLLLIPQVHLQETGVHLGSMTVDPGTLQVTADDGRLLSAAAQTVLGPPSAVTWSGTTARWSYQQSGLSVTATQKDGRLAITVDAASDGEIAWPVTGTDPNATSVQFPLGEGLTIPVDDPFWNSADGELDGTSWDLMGGLRMPFWGYTIGSGGAGYIVPTDIGTTLDFHSQAGRLHATSVHTFSAREDTRSYEVDFSLTGPSPIAAGLDYRAWLQRNGGISPLARKPGAGKLAGAFHAYLWGDARKPQAISKLQAAGIGRMLLSWDADTTGTRTQTVTAAKQAGYLAGPYDSWDNGQDPKTADTPIAKWPGTIYPDACVRKADGTIQTGFGGRGCYLSSQALTLADLKTHVDPMMSTGPNAYFLDVDSAGELFSDYSAAHPMNNKQDLRNKQARMAWLTNSYPVVVGGESAMGWANPLLSFSHGSSTPNVNGLWPLERDTATWGAWWPDTAPAFFFKPVTLPANLAKQLFDPRYRVPLYESVLHDSVVSTDRWELSYYKVPALQSTRFLQAMIANTPLNLALDGPVLDAKGAELGTLQRYFQPLHQAAFGAPLTSFAWLTADRLVQRSVFGGGVLTVTANFSAQPYGTLPPNCVDAQLQPDARPRRICPVNGS